VKLRGSDAFKEREGQHRIKALRAFLTIVRDPTRLDEVFSLREALDDQGAVLPLLERVRRSERGAAALRDRPRVGRLDPEELARMPEGSLGRAYAAWMKRNGLDPAAIPMLPANDDVQYFSAHLYETHDIWHVVTGFGPDTVGEIGLQAFYLAQLEGQLPLAILAAGMLNTLAHPEIVQPLMREIVRGWELGRRARPFFGVRWAEMWRRPLVEVQRELGVARDEGAQALAAAA
jgi:ubiquinone biosynthesis protein Coq4